MPRDSSASPTNAIPVSDNCCRPASLVSVATSTFWNGPQPLLGVLNFRQISPPPDLAQLGVRLLPFCTSSLANSMSTRLTSKVSGPNSMRIVPIWLVLCRSFKAV